MLTLAAPALWLRLGSSDAGNDPASFTTRRAYDLLAQGFGPGFNGPLTLVVKLPHAHDTAALTQLGAAVARTPDVDAVAPATAQPFRRRRRDQRLSRLLAAERGHDRARQAVCATRCCRRSRRAPAPRSTSAARPRPSSTSPASSPRSCGSSSASSSLLSALLLLVVFRSLLIPLQAALMNLLSIGAALGVCVAVFQFGWLPGISPGPIDAFVPVLMFAIVFGLSMDYEVFLVSRIHEEWTLQRDSSAAVRDGLIETGRVITAAAAVMVVVFASFIFGGERVIELFGLGLASAVFLDALVIRCVLLPAVLELLGARAWAFPGWLDRRLPRFAIEHDGPVPHVQPARPVLEDA